MRFVILLAFVALHPTFLSAQSATCPNLPDLQISLDSVRCTNGSARLHYSFCNTGGQPYIGVAFFGLYAQNPFQAAVQPVTWVIHTGLFLQPGDCAAWTLDSEPFAATPFLLDTFPTLYGLIGIHPNMPQPVKPGDFPFPPNKAECSYLNNLDSIGVPKKACSTCDLPATFVKKLGDPQRDEMAFSMCPSSDGNVYLLGRRDDDPVIAKITPLGETVWVRYFPTTNPNEPLLMAEIMEDSEGKLVFCGTLGASPSSRRGIIMRYDPQADTVIWYKHIFSIHPEAVSILEKTPGGNYLLCTRTQQGNAMRSELWEIDRATGTAAPGGWGYRFGGTQNARFESILEYQGNLYIVGSIFSAPSQPLLAKISTSDVIVGWSRAIQPDSSQTIPEYYAHTDVAIDGGLIVIAGSGQRQVNEPSQGIYACLAKHSANGDLLWMKRYDISLNPEDIIVLPDAYVLFGIMAGNRWGMLKTDKNGNVLAAKILEIPAPPSVSTTFIPNRQRQILPTGNHLLMLDHTQGAIGQDIVLLRTDLHFGLDDEDCDLLQPAQVAVQDMPAKTTLGALNRITMTSNYSDAGVQFYPDSLPVARWCPPACDSLPDPDPDPCTPATFIKHIGKTGRFENMSCLRPAPNGNLYLAGRKGNNITVSMMTPEVKFLGARDIFEPTTEQIFLSEFIVDSEGMMVGCGVKGEGAGLEGFAFRYDPNAGLVKWAQRLTNIRPSDCGILEKSPGGNFLLYQNANFTNLQKEAEILELDRATGQIVPAFARRYKQNWRQSFNSMVAEGNVLYAVGFSDSTHAGAGTLVRRMTLTRLDAATGDVVWARSSHLDWEQPAYLQGADLIVDANTLISVYSGSETSFTGQPSSVFLQKTTLAGTVLWVKRFDLPGKPKEIVSVPDGYVILVADIDRYLLKTDKAGKLLVAKKLINPPADPFNEEVQNQILVLGSNLYIADYAANSASDQYTTLLKTDLNLGIEFACDKYVPIQVQVSDVAGPINLPAQQSVSSSPTTRQIVPTTLAIPDMFVRTACPDCSDTTCTDKPDIIFQIDSVGCDSAAFVTYRLCNTGKQPFTGPLQVGVYGSNPLTGIAILLDRFFFQIDSLLPDSCQTGTLNKIAYWGNYSKVYTLAGIVIGQVTPVDPAGFPYNDIAECDYANNLDSLIFQYPPAPPLDLGPNTGICPGDTLLLGAGLSGFVSYTWQDGSTNPVFAVANEGLFSLTTRDGCGRTASDNIAISLKSQPKVTREIVLLPGDSVVIDGKTYTTSDTVISYIPSATGVCDTVVTNNIRLDSLHCDKPGAFFKVFKGMSSRVVLPAADGGYYVGGGTSQGFTLAKFDATGKNIWVRQFNLFGSALIQTLIEDSEGMLVGSATSEGSPSVVLVFRYNPTADQLLWVKRYSIALEDVRGHELVEKKPGGNYLLALVRRASAADFKTEMITFDRATGTVSGGDVWRYERSALTSIEVKQDTLYAFGILRDTSVSGLFWRNGLMKIDLNTGTTVWTKLTKTADGDLFGGNLLLDDEGNLVNTTIQPGQAIWLQKTAPNGDLLWLQKIRVLDPNESQFFPLGLVRLNDGYAIGIQTYSDITNLHAYVVVKTDKNGGLLWSKKVPRVGGTFTISPQQLAGRGNEVCFTTNLEQQVFNVTGMILGRFDKYGNLGGSCALVEDVPVAITQHGGSQVAGLVNINKTSGTFDSPALSNSVPVLVHQNTFCSRCLPPCDSIAVQQTIEFYPGDTITLGGTDYAQSDTVILTLTTDEGCDSMVTYILRLVVTNVDFVCPPDQTVSIPTGQSSVSVSYPQPAAATDCPDPGLVLTRLQGPASGALFPEGTTLVCYEAANQCGIRDTCCFTVTAQKTADETACDVKIPPGSCIKYELLGIRLDALGRPRYRMRLTNTCASPLRFAYFQLPNGMTAKAPLEGATYMAPGGNTYLVRNPNAAPFHSIRFKPVSGTLNNGKSDIFEYTLPKQAQPAFILVSAKLEDGSSSEAHINTFSCPVQPYVASVQEPSVQERHAGTAASVSVRPNPTSGMLFVEITGVQNQSARIQVLNAQGQLVLEGEHSPGRALQLPVGLANGLYFLLVQPADGGARVATRFVLER